MATAVLASFEACALHCPMDFYYFPPGPDLEKRMFTKS